jgi:hypothetical protein
MQKTFKILLRRRVPLLSEALWQVMMVLMLVIFLFYLAMFPTRNSPDEIATVYYIFIIPEWLKKASLISLIGLIVSMPLYFILRINKRGLITISGQKLFIRSKGLNLEFHTEGIKRIYFNDLHTLSGEPKNKLQIGIQMKNDMTILFRLVNYQKAEQIAGCFGNLTDVELAFSNRNMPTMHHDE